MTVKSNAKSNNQTRRGGKRPGAGRPRKDAAGDLRERRVQSAVDALSDALKAYDDADLQFSPTQHRWHLAMLLFGVSPEIIARALFEPKVSTNFSRDVANAIKAVEAGIAA
jgi:hypothetical protein